MTIPNCSPHWEEILAHFLEGKPYSSQAKEHYSQCTDCIAAVTAELDKIPTLGMNGRTTVLPEASRAALEHGREVLDREFGIRSNNMPRQPV